MLWCSVLEQMIIRGEKMKINLLKGQRLNNTDAVSLLFQEISVQLISKESNTAGAYRCRKKINDRELLIP